MKSSIRFALLLSLLFFSSLINADSNYAVAQWTKQTLLKTFSINYNHKKEDFDQIKKNYTYNAWDAIVSFLGGPINQIRSQKLTLHPVAEEPIVINSGTWSGLQYWRVDERIYIPELYVTLSFSLTIFARDPSKGSPFIIHSMSISKTMQ